MHHTAIVISVVAIVIALVSLGLSLRADRRQHRAELREGRREQRELEESAVRRRGKPIVIPRGDSGGSTAERVQHMYEVKNAGQSTITELTLWIEDAGGKTVSTRAGGERFVLAPSGAPAFATVEVMQPLPDEQTLMISWTDADGEHGPESTGIRPPRHM